MSEEPRSKGSLRASIRIWWYQADTLAIFHVIITPVINFCVVGAAFVISLDSDLGEGVLEGASMTATILMGLVFVSGLLRTT